MRTKGNHSGPALGTGDESAAKKIVRTGLRLWKIPDGKQLLEATKKGQPRKVAMAVMIKRHTSAGNNWLAMGHDRSVSRLIRQGNDHEAVQQRYKET